MTDSIRLTPPVNWVEIDARMKMKPQWRSTYATSYISNEPTKCESLMGI